MKLRLSFIIIFVFFILLSGCDKSTKDNASPENLYKEDNSIDLLVYNDTAYVNAEDLDWVTELELENGEELGTIVRTGVTKDFKDFDATVLEVDTKVCSVVGRDDIVLVLIDGKWIPYYAYVEG